MSTPVVPVSRDRQLRVVAESAQGTTPAGDMQVIPMESFAFTGTAPTREKAGNTTTARQPAANLPVTAEPQATGNSDSLYAHYLAFLLNLFGRTALEAAVTVTGTGIAAVASGNKLTGPAGTPWAGIVAGDRVVVSGFTTNGDDWMARVTTTPTGVDLVLDTNFKTLVNEAAGNTITVVRPLRLRLGTAHETLSMELWNPNSSKGEVGRGFTVSRCAWEAPSPNKCTLNWSFVGLSVSPITAQLANSTTAAAAQYPHNSNTDIGYKLEPGFGGGIRYGGVMSGARFGKLGWELQKPSKVSGGVGTFGPIAGFSDEDYVLNVNIEVKRDHADAETMIEDGDDKATVASFEWVVADAAGKRMIVHLPALEPNKNDRSGLAQQGEEMSALSYLGKYNPTHGMIELYFIDAVS